MSMSEKKNVLCTYVYYLQQGQLGWQKLLKTTRHSSCLTFVHVS